MVTSPTFVRLFICRCLSVHVSIQTTSIMGMSVDMSSSIRAYVNSRCCATRSLNHDDVLWGFHPIQVNLAM